MKYKCVICGREYKTLKSWVFKHFQKKHPEEVTLKLRRIIE